MEEFILFCDESDKKGKHFSNFYGGLLINAKDHDHIKNEITHFCKKNNLNGEIKWQKTSEAYLEKYKCVIDKLFEYIKSGKIKIRIMFTQNIYIPTGLSKEQQNEEYTRLYYQFIKHAFGIKYIPSNLSPIRLRIYVDNLPETRRRVERFKSFLVSLSQDKDFRKIPVEIRKEDVTEIDSKEHIYLQLIDLILGAMAFRLNDKHKEIPLGKKRRGKRTKSKECLYKHINTKIRNLSEDYKHFNIGANTRCHPYTDLWNNPYRHWKFVPSDHIIDTTKSKANKKAPTDAT